MPLAAILLAAAAAPFGNTPLALLPWLGEDTLIEYQIDQLLLAGVRDIEVVLGDRADTIIPLIARDNVEPIIDGAWRTAIASSLRVGTAAIPRGTDVALIVDVAEPRTADIYRTLIDAHMSAAARITRPAYEGTPGKPVVVDAATLAEVRNLQDVPATRALDTIFQRYSGTTATVAFDTPLVLLRIDSAEAYERARALFAAN